MSKKFKKRVLFVGMPDMASVCLDGLVAAGVNIVGVFGSKKNHPTYYNFKNLAQSYELNFLEYDRLDDEDFVEQVRNLNADIAVVCSFNYKIPKVLLDAVKGGFINAHPSLLPDYRGSNPYSAVILNEETQTGATLHFMDENFDTGDIIKQKALPIAPIETMGTLFNRLNLLVLEMILETLSLFEIETLSATKQTQGQFKIAQSLDEKSLFVDYTKSAKEADTLIRALNPFLLARTMFRNTVVKVLSADVFEWDCQSSVTPGEIIKIENDKFYIATSNGVLAPTSLQFGSFFVGSAKEFVHILNPKLGEKFS